MRDGIEERVVSHPPLAYFHSTNSLCIVRCMCSLFSTNSHAALTLRVHPLVAKDPDTVQALT